MRESLTIFAILLIVLLSALLVGPYLVDWNSQRDWLAAKLSHTVGAQIRIAGPVDVKLLPRPLFRASKVSIAGAGAQDPALTASGLDAELSINSLLQGAVEFVDATVLEPRLTVTTRDDGSLVAGVWDIANPQKFMFRHLRIRNGAVVVRDPAGRERGALAGIDAEGEAETLFGPLRLNGQAHAQTSAFRFRLNTGAYAGRRLRVKLVTDDLKPLAHADLDGTLSLAPVPAGGGAAPAFAGTLAASGSLHVADGAAPVPWQVSAADLKLDSKGLSSTAVELRAGADARALVANGAVLVDFGALPSAALRFKARQLDLDRLAVPPEVAPDTPRPHAAQWLAAFQDLVVAPTAAPLRLTIDWGLDAVTSGDLTFTDAAGTLDIVANAPLRGRFAISGPDGLHLGLDGVVERGAGAVFKGRLDAATRDLPRSAAALAPLAPDAADWVLRHGAVTTVAVGGTVDLSATGLAARDLSATVDGSTVTGALALTRGVGADPPRLFADLRADTLDTDHLPAMADVADLTDPVDLSIGVAASSLKLAHAGFGVVQTGPLALHLTKAGAVVTLDSFSLSGLDGASVTGSAALAADRAVTARGQIRAADAAPLATLLHQVVPNGATDALLARSALVSPLGLDFSLSGTLDRDGRLTPTLATAKGTAAATRFSATVTPEPARLFAAPSVNLLAVLDAPDGGALLQQLGQSTATPVVLGPSHVELTARGTPESGYDTHLTASLADATLGFDGHAEGDTGSGHLKASGRNAGPLLKALALANAPAAALWPWTLESDFAWSAEAVQADRLTGHFAGTAVSGALARAVDTGALSGSLALDALPFANLAALVLGPVPAVPVAPGHWLAEAPFAALPATLPPAQLQMGVHRLDVGNGLVLADAAFGLRVAPGSLGLSALSGSLLGGTVNGALTLRRDGATASLSGQMQVTDIALALPSLAGRISGSLSLAGSGTSPDAVLASLAGDGALSFQGTMPRFDPRALAAIARDYDSEGITIDADAIRDSLGKALDKAALDVGPVSGPATMAAGTLRTGTLQAPSAAGAVATEASFDLRTLQLALRTTFKTSDLPKDWRGDPPEVTVTVRGPLNAPLREVDAGAFVNGVAARAIARDQDRIQLMQDDLRERAFFARRLRHIEDEQRATREAADKAKAAAAIPTPPARPGSGDPLARFLNTLPMPPVPPSRPLDRSSAAPPSSTLDSNAADPSAAGRY